MSVELKTVVVKLAEKSQTSERADDAMKFAQAALNVANAYATIENTKR